MGLLDDAIRDHLELKRRRGADPGEVAREQREALAPPGGYDEGPATDLPIESVASELSDQQTGGAPAHASDPSGAAAASAGETAEIDMQDVFAEEQTGGSEDGTPGPDSGRAPHPEGPEDVLEETPDFLRHTPEQDRLWFEQRPPRDFDFDK
ncbi:MAG: hypothetical protein E6G34_06575 [Actinobacteria bacterium]|nr:MAG: hypothetical protein E6G34_06575 [Actinomycetota bacterium]